MGVWLPYFLRAALSSSSLWQPPRAYICVLRMVLCDNRNEPNEQEWQVKLGSRVQTDAEKGLLEGCKPVQYGSDLAFRMSLDDAQLPVPSAQQQAQELLDRQVSHVADFTSSLRPLLLSSHSIIPCLQALAHASSRTGLSWVSASDLQKAITTSSFPACLQAGFPARFRAYLLILTYGL